MKKINYKKKDSLAGMLFTLPFTIGFVMFLVIPMGISLYYSFCDFDILTPPKWCGLKNYVRMFTADETFVTALKATLYFAVASVPLRLVFALMVAIIMKKKSRLTGLYRGIYYFPSVIGGSVAVAILWRRLFALEGPINRMLGLNISWLGGKSTAMWVLIILSVWQFGASMLIFLSALKQIPTDLYEAARVDGSGGIHSFFKITLPLLTPTIFFNLVMETINGFMAFTQSYLVTDGKPMDSTLFYTVYVYRQSFEYYNAGYASAMAWILLIIVGIVSAVLFLTKRFWVYEGGV